MRKIKWSLETGFAGCVHKGEFEVDDNATDEEIEELAREEVFNCINWNWWEEKEAEKSGEID